MKKLSLILGILIFIDILYHASLSNGQVTNVYLTAHKHISMDSGILLLSLTLYSALGTFLICLYKILGLKERIKKQTRNLEKSLVETEDASDKVKSLQAKIDTLEIALREALNNK